ncbi:hypothetical protein KRR26_23865 [Corallococcus sp. M34]|uniref:ion channel n=1 Tax=Citreicoccus inhibens TaxID=2849499 RepID=UPI0013155699|nr:ion channel [Citreicoccus inhibens]MBU8898652.1 hypothetical protein [Citreicoccus inhibens]
MSSRPVTVRPPGADYQIRVLGHRPTPLRDFYHALLELPWSATFAILSALYLLVNALFAAGYLATGGVVHAAAGSFWDAFCFSVQTLGTIGYGAMYPDAPAAHALVVVESLVGLLTTALATGLVFAKFSRPQGRIVFSHHPVVCPLNGVPTLMFRLGNERGNQIVNAEIRVVLMRTESSAEGLRLYRTYDLKLARDRALSLQRSWIAMHVIDATSPLHGQTPESIAAQEVEVQVMVLGTDDITMQSLHAGHRYFAAQLRWGARLVDILSEAPDGNLELDLRKFHDTQPSQPTEGFPYPRAS